MRLVLLLAFLATWPVVAAESPRQPYGVCPPFPLRDEAGNVINPVADPKIAVPYSPRQTCGAAGCHDYDKITQGFHFTQGKGEAMPKEYAARYQWASSPGNYGGNWCSPAPLYRQLAAKKNTNPRTIDMTSFDFVTATCGNCHPGGGPMEFDRDGKRYDRRMADPGSGFTPGGENGLDGDYYKARWSETGVIEADCLLCHSPEYNFKKPAAWRWLPLAGLAGLIAVLATPGLLTYMTVDRFRMDANHFWVALAVIGASVWAAGHARPQLQRTLYALVAITGVCGVLMLLRFGWLEMLNRLAYTGFDLGLTLLAGLTAIALAARLQRIQLDARA